MYLPPPPSPLPAGVAASVQLVRPTPSSRLHDWDSGAQWERRVAKQAQMRFQAREYEQRITREQVGGVERVGG